MSSASEASDTEEDSRLKMKSQLAADDSNSRGSAGRPRDLADIKAGQSDRELVDDDYDDEDDDDEEDDDEDADDRKRKGGKAASARKGAASKAAVSGRASLGSNSVAASGSGSSSGKGGKNPAKADGKGKKVSAKVNAFQFDGAGNGFDPANAEQPFQYAPDPTCRLSIDLKPNAGFCVSVGMGGALKTIRGAVSKKKKRFTEGDFDLDLTYITPKVSDRTAAVQHRAA
jgi:hypothetical protein